MPFSRYEMRCCESSEQNSIAHPRCQGWTDFCLIILFIYLSIFGHSGSLLLCMLFFSCGEWGLFLQLRCVGVSLQWLLLLWSMGSRAYGFQQLQHVGSAVVAPRLQNTGSVVVAHGLVTLWHVDLPRPGTEPVSPAVTGILFTTEPPGKPLRQIF